MLYPQSAIDQQPVSTYLAYNGIGALVKEGFAADYVATNPTSSPAIHQITSTDGRGLVTSESYGVTASNSADWRTNSVFDSSGWLLAQCVNRDGMCSSAVPTTTVNVPLEQRYRFDVYGNLKTQWHSGAWLQGIQIQAGVQGKETYKYDALHRLIEASRTSANSATETVNYGYDDVGGLLKKSDYSQDTANAYSYQAGTHKVQSVALKTGNSVSYGFDANGNVTQRNEAGSVTTLEYDIGNLPMRMQRGFNTSDFYEGLGGRYVQRLVSNGNQRDTYSLDKSYEREIVGGAITLERYYLTSGALMTVAPGSRKLNYLHNV